MAIEAARLEIVVDADTRKAQAELNNIGTSATKSVGPMQGLTKSFGAFATGGAITAGLAATGAAMFDMAKAAAEDAASVDRLEQAVENAEGSFDAHAAAINRAVEAGQHMAFTDDETRAALALMTAQTGDADEALRRLSTAQNLARGAGIDLATAAKLIGKTSDENTSALSRMGIAVEDAATAQDVLNAVDQKFAGQAGTFAASDAAKFDRMTDSVDEAQEAVGTQLLPIMVLAADQATATANNIGILAGEIENLAGLIPGVGESSDGVITSLAKQSLGMITYVNSIRDANHYINEWFGTSEEAAAHNRFFAATVDTVSAAIAAEAQAFRESTAGTTNYGSTMANLNDTQRQATIENRKYQAAIDANTRTLGDLDSQLMAGTEHFYEQSVAAQQAALAQLDLADAAQTAWQGQINLNTAWADATGAVGFWETNLSNAEQALKILDGEMEENGSLNQEQQRQYDLLTDATGRYKGGIEDTEGAVVDAAVAQAEFINGQDRLNGLLADGKIAPADYAREMANLTAQTDPATSSAYNLAGAQGDLQLAIEGVVNKLGNLLIDLGILPESKRTEFTTPGLDEAQEGVDGLNGKIASLPTSFTIYAQMDYTAFDAGMKHVAGFTPQSPAKEGPLSHVPDWSFMTWTLGPTMEAAAVTVMQGGSAIVNGIATSVMQGGSAVVAAVTTITDMIRDTANANINAAHESFQASGEDMAKALVEGFGKGTYDLAATVATMSTDTLAALSRMEQELASELNLARIAGADAEELADLQRQLDAITGIITAWAAQTGVTVTEALDAAAVGPAVVDGWMDLVGNLDALLSGELTTGLAQKLRDIQAQIQFALAAGAPEEVIAQLQANLAAVQAEYEMAGAAYSAAIQAGMVEGWTTEGAAAVADKMKSVFDGTLLPQLEQQLADLNNLIAFGTAAGWAPELLAIYEEQAAEISDELAQVSEDMAAAAAAGLLSDEALAAWNDAMGIVTEIPLDALKKLLPKMSDGGLSLVEDIAQGVVDGTTSMEDAFAFLIGLSEKSLSDLSDTNDVAVKDIIAELHQLEESLVVDLAQALINGTDPSAIEANLAAIADMLRLLQAEADKTVKALSPLDKLHHNTGNYQGGGGGGWHGGASRGGAPIMSPGSGVLLMQPGGGQQTVVVENHTHVHMDSNEIARYTSQQTMRQIAGQLSSGVTA